MQLLELVLIGDLLSAQQFSCFIEVKRQEMKMREETGAKLPKVAVENAAAHAVRPTMKTAPNLRDRPCRLTMAWISSHTDGEPRWASSMTRSHRRPSAASSLSEPREQPCSSGVSPPSAKRMRRSCEKLDAFIAAPRSTLKALQPMGSSLANRLRQPGLAVAGFAGDQILARFRRR